MVLTWQNVAPPDFSGSMVATKAAGDSLTNGFGAAQNALAAFQKSKLDQAKFEDDHRRALLGDTTVQLQNDGQVTQNQGYVLDNQGKAITNYGNDAANKQTDWINQQTKDRDAARPDAVKAILEANIFASDGTPEGRAKANQHILDKASSLTKFGMNQESANLVTKTLQDFTGKGQDLNKGERTQAEEIVQFEDGKKARDLWGLAAQAISPELGANTIASAEGYSPAQRQLALEGFQKSIPALYPAVDPLNQIGDQRALEQQDRAKQQAQTAKADQATQMISYANQGATRNRPLADGLVNAMEPILNKYGVTMQVFSGGQPSKNESKGGDRVGKEGHDHGNAGDVEFFAADGHKLMPDNPNDLQVLKAMYRDGYMSGVTGWGEGESYMGKGRIHIGTTTNGVWGKSNHYDSAPQWLKDSFDEVRGKRTTDISSVSSATPGQVPDQIGLQKQSMTDQGYSRQPTTDALGNPAVEMIRQQSDQNETLYNRNVALGNQANTLSDTLKANGAMQADAGVLDKIVSGKEANMSVAEATKKLVDAVGADTADMNPSEITDTIVRMKEKYPGVRTDVITEVLMNGVGQNTWGTRWWSGSTGFTKAMDAQMKDLFGPDAANKVDMNVLTAKIARNRASTEILKTVESYKERAAKDEQAYFSAASKNKGKKNADLSALKRRYQQSQDLLEGVIKRGESLGR